MKNTKTLRICTLLLTFAMVVSLLSSCYFKIPGIAPKPEDLGDIYIYFTGDTHCADDEGVGFAGVKSIIDKTKEKSPYVTLVDTGDAVFGDILGNDSEGEYIVELMNDVGYHLAVPGNHEFDYGIERLTELIELSDATYLSCNITYTGSGENPFANILHPYAIKHYGDTKVGFVGVTTPESITSSNPQSFMEGGEFVYDFAKTEDGEKFYSTVQSAIDNCKKDGANYVILLTHLGDGEEYGIFSSDTLISKVSGVSAVLDGHAHNEIPCRMVTDKEGAAVPLASTGTKLDNIGRLVITPSGNITVGIVNGSIGRDEEIDKTVDDANAAYAAKLSEVIANSAFPLSTHIGDERVVRNRETALGNLCADAYRAAADADIAFINGGCIRASLPAGDITYAHLLALQPFGNELSVVRTTGAEIADALEFSVRNSALGDDGEPEGEDGGFLSVSGIKFRVDTTVPTSVATDALGMFANVGGDRRVKDIMVLGEGGEYEAIDPEAEYTLVSVNYILEDMGDGYSMFKDNEFAPSPEKKDIDAVIDYLKSFDGATIPDTYAATEGRIVIE